MPLKKIFRASEFDILNYVCEYKDITIQELRSKSREQDVVMARVLVSYVYLHQGWLGWGLQEIADLTNIDHSSVHRYKRTILDDMDTLVKENIRDFRVFLIEKGFVLPNVAELKKRFDPRINNK